jgi:hypothetical protein
MSVQQFYDAARTVLEQHNEAIGEGEGLIDIDKFLTCLKATGATDLKTLVGMSLENILNCLPQVDGPGGWVKPWPLAKKIKAAFKELAPKSDGGEIFPVHKPRPVSSKKAEKMTIEELVNAFDPEDPGPVGKVLHQKAKKKAFIVYSSGRNVDVEATLVLLKEVKQGYEARAHYKGKKVYAVGELPENYADENPLYRGRPLRPDGTCDQTNRSWEGIPLEVRQFIAFCTEWEDGIDVTGKGGLDRAHQAMNMAIAADALNQLRNRYPEIAIEFDEAQKLGKLPTLQIPLGQPVAAQEVGGGPFPVGVR